MKMQSGKKYLSYTLATSMLTVMVFGIVTACSDRQAKARPNIVTKPAPKAGVAAKIGDQLITDEELIGEDKMDFFELKKREYELKMDRINRLMTEKLLGAEAKKANLSLEDYITKNIVKGDTKISDAEIKKFIITPRDGGVINLTCSVTIHPNSEEVSQLAKLVQDQTYVSLEGPQDLFDSTNQTE